MTLDLWLNFHWKSHAIWIPFRIYNVFCIMYIFLIIWEIFKKSIFQTAYHILNHRAIGACPSKHKERGGELPGHASMAGHRRTITGYGKFKRTSSSNHMLLDCRKKHHEAAKTCKVNMKTSHWQGCNEIRTHTLLCWLFSPYEWIHTRHVD